MYGGHAIHDPASDTFAVDPVLTLDLRQTAALDFSLPRTHPASGTIKVGSCEPEIEVWDGDEIVMKGRAYDSYTVDFSGMTRYRCEGDLAYFDDSVVRPYSTVSGEAPALAPSDPYGYFNWIVGRHNDQVEPAKKFSVGINQGNFLSDRSGILRSDSTYPSTRKVIREKLMNSLGGFIRTRYRDGSRFVDYLADTDGVAEQRIEFGKNLLDFAQKVSSDKMYSVIVPLGEEDGAGKRLTVSSAADGDVDSYGRFRKFGDAVESADAIAEIGRKSVSVVFEDISNVQNLLSRAVAWLDGQKDYIETIVVRAIDLSMIDPGIEPIRIGDYVRCVSSPNDFDSYMICSRVVYDIADPRNNEYTLGIEGGGIGDIVRKHAASLNEGINGAYEAAGQVDRLAKEAQERAEAAKSAADKAQQDADAAKEAADKAKAEAEKALADALKAAQDALDAKRGADEATAKVEVAETDLRAVKEGVSAAQAAAEAAGASASEAAGKADSAAKDAADAMAESQKAVGSAAEAAVTAGAAQAEAAGAKADAAKVRADLEGQIKTVVDTMSADYTKKTDLTLTESRLLSEIERSAAGIASTVAEEYARKTDLSEVESSLSTRIAQNAGAIELTAKSVESLDTTVNGAAAAAAAAKAQADAAQSAAAKASSNADAAQAAADAAAANLAEAEKNLDAVSIRVGATEEDVRAAEAAVEAARKAAADAQSSAAGAKEGAAAAKATAEAAAAAAAKAQAAADALGVRVTSAETKISQNSEAIVLRATKTEVAAAKSEALSGAAADAKSKADAALAGAKTYADAQIKVQADRITSNVAATNALGTRVSTVEQTASGLSVSLSTEYAKKTIPDTRSANQNPQWYMSNYPKQVVAEFKTASVIGLSGEGFAVLETTVPWTDSSGGWPKQSAKIAGKEYWRIAASATAWGAWSDALGLAGTANGTAAAAKTSAATAQSAANAAQSAASTAQSTANTAKTNAATAQSTANTARTEAAAAAKTATNYMQFTSAGLEVGNRSSGVWAGFRTRMASSAFQVLDGAGTVLASYGASLVEIGRNAKTAVIKLCGGLGTIKQTTESFAGGAHSSLTIESSESVAVKGTNAEITATGSVFAGNVKSTPADPSQACGLTVDASGNARVSGYNAYVYAAGTVDLSGERGVSIGGQAVNDFVVAQGNSGIWRWRKWASGFAECSGVTTSPASTGTDNWHWLGYDTTLRGGHALPFRFPSIAAANVTIEDPTGGAFFPGVKKISNDKAPTFFILSAQGYSRTVWIHYDITGTWK